MVHVENRQLKRGVDDEVVALAVAEERVPVLADTDFESGGCRFGDVQR